MAGPLRKEIEQALREEIGSAEDYLRRLYRARQALTGEPLPPVLKPKPPKPPKQAKPSKKPRPPGGRIRDVAKLMADGKVRTALEVAKALGFDESQAVYRPLQDPAYEAVDENGDHGARRYRLKRDAIPAGVKGRVVVADDGRRRWVTVDAGDVHEGHEGQVMP